jgi:uncharacterized protein DUF6603
LRFEASLALTSNTVQFGARLDFSHSDAVFTLAGFLGFNALFQFAPFQFIADDGFNPRPTWESGATWGFTSEPNRRLYVSILARLGSRALRISDLYIINI